MALSDVKIVISVSRPSGTVTFGKPLILAVNDQAKAYAEYTSLEAVEVDYPDTTEAYNVAAAVFDQDNPPAVIGIASAATAAALPALLEVTYEQEWYVLLTTERDQATIIAIADKIEQTDKGENAIGRLFSVDVANTTVLAALKAKEYNRTFVAYNPNENEYMAAAWIGDCAADPVGSLTWKFKTLIGVTPSPMTLTQLNAIHNGGGNAYVKKAGEPQTSEGRVVSGEYIDVVMSKDWVAYDMSTRTQRVFTSNRKVPFTNTGFGLLEAAARETLAEAYKNGMIAEEGNAPLYGTAFKKRAEVSALDREARNYEGGSAWFELAGAVHKTKIAVEIRI